jgi:indole-3-glycerol phosphate synthase
MKVFYGSLDDLLLASSATFRKRVYCGRIPNLEAKAYGADLILLIAAVLTREEIKSLSEFAKILGLEVLLA